MGMFDYYKPAKKYSCPVCGTPLKDWQGKDGPCCRPLCLAKGEKYPVDQLVDDKVRSSARRGHDGCYRSALGSTRMTVPIITRLMLLAQPKMRSGLLQLFNLLSCQHLEIDEVNLHSMVWAVSAC